MVELAEWLLQMYSRNWWIKKLLDSRKIIIVPAVVVNPKPIPYTLNPNPKP